jgi:hypothetical protein
MSGACGAEQGRARVNATARVTPLNLVALTDEVFDLGVEVRDGGPDRCDDTDEAPTTDRLSGADDLFGNESVGDVEVPLAPALLGDAPHNRLVVPAHERSPCLPGSRESPALGTAEGL